MLASGATISPGSSGIGTPEQTWGGNDIAIGRRIRVKLEGLGLSHRTAHRTVGDRDGRNASFRRNRLNSRPKNIWRMTVLHLLYVLVFMILAVVAVSNLIRNMITLGRDVQRQDSGAWSGSSGSSGSSRSVPHPELLDASGRMTDEPLMVMKAMPIEDVRSQLDALFEASPGGASADSGDGSSEEV